MARKKNIIVTTCDLKREYQVIGPVYFQVSNKGLFSSALGKLIDKYQYEIAKMRQQGTMSEHRMDWGFLYGEWSVGQNDFEKAFFVATEELKERARILGADAIIGMRQDIDMDTNGFQYFYLQMYGTAVKYLDGEAEYLPEEDIRKPAAEPETVCEPAAPVDDEELLAKIKQMNSAAKIADLFVSAYGRSPDADIQKLKENLLQLKQMEGLYGNNKENALRWVNGFFDHGKTFHKPERSGFKIVCPLCSKEQSKSNSICENCGALFRG